MLEHSGVFRKTFSHHNRSASLIVDDDEDQPVVKAGEEKSAIERLLERTNSREVVRFGSLYDEDDLLKAKKVGEGSFGEVFLLTGKGESSGRVTIKFWRGLPSTLEWR